MQQECRSNSIMTSRRDLTTGFGHVRFMAVAVMAVLLNVGAVLERPGLGRLEIDIEK